MAVDNSLSTKVELHLQCKGLPKLDRLSKSDPFVVIYMQRGQGLRSEWVEVARTSTIKNAVNAEWPDHIIVDYHFEKVQHLKFDVYDRDAKSEDLKKHDFIGNFEITMSQLMGSRGSTVSGNLKGKRRFNGKIIIRGQETSTTADIVHFQFKAKKLSRMNYFGLGKSDPFYVIKQINADGSYVSVFKSEVKKLNLNPTWKKQSVPVQRICNGDLERPLRIEIYDWESSGKHQYMGAFETTLGEMSEKRDFVVYNEQSKANKKKAGSKNSGSITLLEFRIETRYTFLQFIQGGMDMNLMVAIDFTASNGHPLDEISLHRMPQDFQFTGSTGNIPQLNQYQSAIYSVGRILQDYDRNRQFPVFGFGAKVDGRINHCFPLTFDNNKVAVTGVEGIMDAYSTALQLVQLSGPTLFGPIVKRAVQYAREAMAANSQKYWTLLIITDGIINDMDETIKNIVEGASLPLSIIIVGVGNADFSNMETLDGDDVRISYRGKPAERDIVQFVPYTEVSKMGSAALAEQVLEEIPDQVVSFFASKKIAPGNAQAASSRHFASFRLPESNRQIPISRATPSVPNMGHLRQEPVQRVQAVASGNNLPVAAVSTDNFPVASAENSTDFVPVAEVFDSPFPKQQQP